MNERIKELASRAGMLCDKYGLYWNAHDNPDDGVDLEKFAELIVKETMQVVANNLPQNTYIDVADAVIEHFRVES